MRFLARAWRGAAARVPHGPLPLSYGRTTPYLPVLEILRQLASWSDRPGGRGPRHLCRALQAMEMAPKAWAPVLLSLLGGRRRAAGRGAQPGEARQPAP